MRLPLRFLRSGDFWQDFAFYCIAVSLNVLVERHMEARIPPQISGTESLLLNLAILLVMTLNAAVVMLALAFARAAIRSFRHRRRGDR